MADDLWGFLRHLRVAHMPGRDSFMAKEPLYDPIEQRLLQDHVTCVCWCYVLRALRGRHGLP